MFNFLKKIMPTSDATPNPLLSITDLIDYASVRPEHVVPAVKSLAAQVEAALEKADAPSTPASWENTVEPLEKAVLAFGRAWGAVGHLRSATPSMRRCLSPRIYSSGFLRMKSSVTSTENSPLRLSSKSLPRCAAALLNGNCETSACRVLRCLKCSANA